SRRPQRRALADTPGMPQQHGWRACIPAVPQEYLSGIVRTAVIDQNDFVRKTAGKRPMDFIDQDADIARLIPGRNQNGHKDGRMDRKSTRLNSSHVKSS